MRIRTIKPDFWCHPVLARLPDAIRDSIRLCALGLLTMSDDEGYFLASPEQVRSDLWPAEETSEKARDCLARLLQVGYIEVREHPTHGPIGRVVNFLKHQRVDHPSKSKLKVYYEKQESSRGSVEPREEPLADQGSGIRDQGREQGPTPEASRESAAGVEAEPRLVALTNAGVLVDRTKNTRAEWLVALNGTTAAQVVGVLARLGRLKLPVWPSEWAGVVKQQAELEDLAEHAKRQAEVRSKQDLEDAARKQRAADWDTRALAEAPAVLAGLGPLEDLMPNVLAAAARIRDKVAARDKSGLGFALERLKQIANEQTAALAARVGKP